MEAEVVKLSKLLLLTLSVPIKPGSVHRLRLDYTFEQSLEEAVHVITYMQEAYKRGVELRRGSRSIQTLGFGRIVYNSLVRVFEDLEKRPLLGLHVASLTSALLLGYVEGDNVYRRVSNGVKLLYRTTPEEVVSILEGMEASSLGDELRFLDSKGVSRRWAMIQGASLGDFYEVMEELDTGFMLNLRGLRILKEVKGRVAGDSLYSRILKSYLVLGNMRGLFKSEVEASLKPLLKLDRDIGYDSRFNSLLGGSFLTALISEL